MNVVDGRWNVIFGNKKNKHLITKVKLKTRKCSNVDMVDNVSVGWKGKERGIFSVSHSHEYSLLAPRQHSLGPYTHSLRLITSFPWDCKSWSFKYFLLALPLVGHTPQLQPMSSFVLVLIFPRRVVHHVYAMPTFDFRIFVHPYWYAFFFFSPD